MAAVLDENRRIDGAGAAARDGMSLLIENGRITQVGKSVGRPPTGAKRLDLAGHTGAYVWDSQPGSVPKLLLAAGVTTARTAGVEAPQVDLNLKRRIDSGKAVGPRLFVTGPYLNGPAGGFLGDNVVETADEARAVTDGQQPLRK